MPRQPSTFGVGSRGRQGSKGQAGVKIKKPQRPPASYAVDEDEAETYLTELGKAKVAKYYLQASEGSAEAQYALGLLHMTGTGMPRDEGQGVKWFRLAAEQGQPNAQYFLGEAYEHGKGVPQDYSEGFKWYLKAAEGGDKYAQFEVGFEYFWGRAVERNDHQAAAWFQRAAAQNDVRATGYLGAMMQKGLGGLPRDKKKAVKLIKLAAEAGDCVGLYNLGNPRPGPRSRRTQWW